MSDDTKLSAAPEPDPACKSVDLETPAEVLEKNIQPETRQTEGRFKTANRIPSSFNQLAISTTKGV
jgi:hypothetical protein